MASPLPPKAGRKTTGLDRPWEPGDSIPAPEAIHRDGDSAWALWTQVSRQHEARFAETAPLSMPMQLTPQERGWARTQPAGARQRLPAGRREAQPLFTLEGAMLLARRNNRVCPRPEQWNALSALLPPRKTLGGVEPPPAPATGAAWAVTPSLTKRLVFREQIEWAEREGLLEEVLEFLQNLREEEWLHMGEG